MGPAPVRRQGCPDLGRRVRLRPGRDGSRGGDARPDHGALGRGGRAADHRGGRRRLHRLGRPPGPHGRERRRDERRARGPGPGDAARGWRGAVRTTRLHSPADLDSITFSAEGGLVPVVAQDAYSGEVLMLGYADRTALARTLETGELWFWSRSRGRLWKKGETSG